MKVRAVLLILLLSGGFYMMLQQADNLQNDLLQSDAPPYTSIIFRQPDVNSGTPVTWVVNETAEINRLLVFLQGYQYERVDADSLELFDDETFFSIDLLDAAGSRTTILVEEGILIRNDQFYYKAVNGPFEINWLLAFIFSNK